MYRVYQQPLTPKAVRARACGAELVAMIAGGKTLSEAAKDMRITSETAVLFVHEMLALLLDDGRWGWNSAVRCAFEKSLHLVFSSHYDLLAEAVVKYRIEMQTGALGHWLESPRTLVSAPRLRKKVQTTLVWTTAMDARLGQATDSKIAQELGVLGCHVQKRRVQLGIASFRSTLLGTVWSPGPADSKSP